MTVVKCAVVDWNKSMQATRRTFYSSISLQYYTCTIVYSITSKLSVHLVCIIFVTWYTFSNICEPGKDLIKNHCASGCCPSLEKT